MRRRYHQITAIDLADDIENASIDCMPSMSRAVFSSEALVGGLGLFCMLFCRHRQTDRKYLTQPSTFTRIS
jgi:hypothetical protein